MLVTAYKLTLKEKILNFKFLTCTILSSIAATGVIPYAARFARTMGISNMNVAFTLGVTCAAAAMLANIVLCTFSLLNIKLHKHEKIHTSFMLTSFIGSMAYGFLCFLGYQYILPTGINVILSIIVVIANTGVGYTALKSATANFKKHWGKTEKIPLGEEIWRAIGGIIGVIISLTMYLGSCDGITILLIHFQLPTLALKYHLGYWLAFISWVPLAALFADSNQLVVHELYIKIKKLKTTLKKTRGGDLMFILFCLFSGSAIAQMMSNSFQLNRQIPEIFKTEFIQIAVNQYLIPVALLSSAALNYFAINKLKSYFID